MQFLMIAQPRTGTTVLRELLNSQAEIYVYGEVLYPDFFTWGFFSRLAARLHDNGNTLLATQWRQHLPGYLGELTSLMRDAGKAVVGFDLKIPQLALIPDIHGTLLSKGYPVLHLRRRNTLATVVSYEIMKKRIAAGGRSHDDVKPAPLSVFLDPQWLKLRISELEVQDAWIRHIYNSQQYLELCYEDFTSEEGWLATRRRLSAFFSVDVQVPFAPKLVKQNSWNLSDLIENSSDIATLYPQFLGAPGVE